MSIANFVQVVQVTTQLLPVIITAIKAVEEALPGSGRGEQKLALVRGMLESAYAATDGLTTTFEQVWPPVKTMITALVAAYNQAGTFRK